MPCTGSNCTTSSTPNDIAISPNARSLYSANLDGAVGVFAIAADGSLAPVACAGCASGNPSINGVAIAPSGRFLYTQTGVSRGTGNISVFAIAADGTLSRVTCSNCATNQQANFPALVITPDQAPVAAFTAAPRPPGEGSTFDGSGSSASSGQTIARYDWSFGDGTNAANGGATPVHTYALPGRYSVTLTVTDDAGCSTALVFTGQTASCNGGPSATETLEITVAEPPSVHITTPTGGAKYTIGQVVHSSFTCTEGSGGPGLASCTDQRGRPSGAPLDTSTRGAHTFTVTATSKDGLTSSNTVSYAVVLAPARVRVSSMHASPLRHGCAVETGRDEREITAVTADATCRHLRLALNGTIQTGGKLASSAGGTITVTYRVKPPRGPASGTGRARVSHGSWHIALVLPGVNLDPLPPSYLITVRYSGDRTTSQATTSRRIRLESERANLHP